MELMGHAPRPSVVILRRVVSGLLAVPLLTYCASDTTDSPSSRVVVETAATTSAAPVEQRGPQFRWACPRSVRLRAFTDPIIYPLRLTLREVLTKVYAAEFDALVRSNDGRLAFVLVLDERRRIERRVRFERSATVGWHVEAVLFCRQRTKA
jgi:hypothetical protein